MLLMLPIIEQSYQNLIEFESTQCTLNEETSEYHVYIKGFYKSGSYVSEEECSNNMHFRQFLVGHVAHTVQQRAVVLRGLFVQLQSLADAFVKVGEIVLGDNVLS